MSFEVSEGGAYAVLYCVLGIFTIIAFVASGLLGTSPVWEKLGCIMLPSFAAASTGKGGGRPTLARTESVRMSKTADFFLAARNSAGWGSIALSFFASGMGAWVVYGSTEMGANPNLSWLGVLGYSAASGFPALIICVIGPRVREITGETRAFATTDFGRERYGRIMQLSIAAISVFYMFIYIVAEFTSISNVYGLLVGVNTFDPSTVPYTRGIAISIAVITFVYTTVGGLPASIITDKYQASLMFALVFILLIVACSNPANQVTKAEFAVASNWTAEGAKAAVSLFIAIACAEMFNQGSWQRVWAAKSVSDMRKGFAVGSIMVFFLMMFFGIMGMLAYANYPEEFDTFQMYYYLGFFELLKPLSNFWHVVVLIIVTALAASSVDTLQNGIACIFSSDLLGFGLSDRACTWITRVLLLAINIPAVIMSSKRFDVIGLFLVADLVCATAVLPVFLGLILEDVHFLIPAPTELGAFLGVISGICTVLVNGVINGHDEAVNAITGEVIATGPFSYFWLTNGAECALCGTKTMVSFIVTPLIAGFFTLLFSRIDILVRGERAREPLIKHELFYKPKDTAARYNLAENKGEEEIVEGSIEEVDAEEAGLPEKDAEAGETLKEEAPANEEVVA